MARQIEMARVEMVEYDVSWPFLQRS